MGIEGEVGAGSWSRPRGIPCLLQPATLQRQAAAIGQLLWSSEGNFREQRAVAGG